MERLRLRRGELYEKVWTAPMQRLAKDFGLSDVGLAKLCRRHQIPVPGRGYWRRLETGNDPGRIPLPPIANPQFEVIDIVIHDKPSKVLAKVGLGDACPLPIAVSPNRPISHPLTKKAKEQLSKGRRDDRGLLIPYGHKTIRRPLVKSTEDW
ncbi:MAG: hypothetical protein L0338_38245 [Acidobacteria bacterium]|nr:hypothetical protein [Acidobacteriota bacterium]